MARPYLLVVALCSFLAGVALVATPGFRTGTAQAAPPASSGESKAAPSATYLVTADTNPSRLESFHVTYDDQPPLVPCMLPPEYRPMKCVKVVKGPFVVTDFTAFASSDVFSTISLFVAPTGTTFKEEGFAPRWRVYPLTPVHGARYLVKSGETLFILANLEAHRFHTMNVSGFRPY